MAKFSLIIPLYNAEKTICRCIDSILQQVYDDFEIILIDDGSADRSYTICTNYEKEDKRIRVYRQDNSGPSAARNLGLEKAKGEWICFIDSDDYISSDYLSELHSLITENADLDMIFMGYYKVDAQNNIIDTITPNITIQKGAELIMELVKRGMFGYTWIKVFRRIKITYGRFREDLSLFEDEIFTCEALPYCNNIAVLEKPLYYYMTCGNDSLMNKTYDDYCYKCDEVYKAWKHLFSLKIDWKPYSSFIENRANFYVLRCRYYGFERKVKIDKFFLSLSQTSFFQEHTSISKLDQYIMNKNYFRLWIEKIKYQGKSALASYIRR